MWTCREAEEALTERGAAVVVCIVSDGRAKINPRTLKILGLQGVYQDGVMKDSVEGRDTQAHVFEYTTQVMVDSDGTVKAGISPIQVVRRAPLLRSFAMTSER